MDPTPACIDAVIQSSAVLRWLHDPAHLTMILVILLAELLIHCYVVQRVLLAIGALLGTCADGLIRLNRWRHYRRLPLDGRVMYHWYGRGAWWTRRAKIWVHRGVEQRPHKEQRG